MAQHFVQPVGDGVDLRSCDPPTLAHRAGTRVFPLVIALERRGSAVIEPERRGSAAVGGAREYRGNAIQRDAPAESLGTGTALRSSVAECVTSCVPLQITRGRIQTRRLPKLPRHQTLLWPALLRKSKSIDLRANATARRAVAYAWRGSTPSAPSLPPPPECTISA